MRYAKSESTYILGIFNAGDTVTIDVYRLSDNAKVVDGASCSEVAGTGVFKYSFSQTVSQKEEYLWIMSNGEYTKYGKIVLGGWMDGVSEKVDVSISSRASQDSVDSANNTLSTLVSDIWNYSTRTLTSFGSLVSDIWNYVTRTLTEAVSLKDTDKNEIADKVWDEPITEHITANTFGAKNQNKVPSENVDDYKANVSDLAKESTVQSIKSQTDKMQFTADNDIKATLDGEVVSLSTDTETQIDNIENNTNEIKQILNNEVVTPLQRILGLSQENYILQPIEYNGSGQLTKGRIKIYQNSTDCSNEENEIASYYIEVEYLGDGRLSKYKVTKE